MPVVELIVHADCPHVAGARAQLRRAFAQAGMEPRWQEYRGDAPDTPAHVRGYGSPTILVDGKDVATGDAVEGACCRLYPQPDGSMSGVPVVEAIASALRAARGTRGQEP